MESTKKIDKKIMSWKVNRLGKWKTKNLAFYFAVNGLLFMNQTNSISKKNNKIIKIRFRK